MAHLIAPSILAADFTRLGEAIEMLDQSSADWVHFDVIDGNFAPNISFGFPILKAIRPLTTKPIDVHLMILDPTRYIEAFADAGADHLTVHYEAVLHLDGCLQAIKDAGMKTGVALNPATPASVLRHVLPMTDIVCIMSINPGFSGQKFLPYTFAKVRELKQMIIAQGTHTQIEIDGGVKDENASDLIEAGADVLVAGSSVFWSDDPKAAISRLKKA